MVAALMDTPPADPNAAAPTAPVEEKTEVDYQAKLLALLGLDATADDAAIDAAISALPNAAALQTKIAELETNLATATEKLSGFEKEASDRAAAAVDETLAGYDLPDAAKAVLRDQLLADAEKGQALLSAMPKKDGAAATVEAMTPDVSGAATPEKKTPPAPKHDPKKAAQKELNPQEKVSEQNALIKKIQGEGRFKDYTAAREEARRQKPDLFS